MAERKSKNPKKPQASGRAYTEPKDAQVIRALLKELNITDYEPGVVNKLLDVTYSHVVGALKEAKLLSSHANKATIDLEDVQLATKLKRDIQPTGPPPKHELAKLAEEINAKPLPPIKPRDGLRLPPDQFCLLNSNYKLRDTEEFKKMNQSVCAGAVGGEPVEKPAASAKHMFAFPKRIAKPKSKPKTVKNGPSSTNGLPTLPNDTVGVANITADIAKMGVKRSSEV